MKHMPRPGHVLGLKCVKCGHEMDVAESLYTCNKCGNNVDIIYDYNAIKQRLTRTFLNENREHSIKRYKYLLPVIDEGKYMPPIPVGMTPLYKPQRLSDYLGIKNLYLKNDTLNPSGSLKDRASIIGVTKALELGLNLMCGASTGNAASSLSCIAASCGMKTIIFVPESAPIGKIAQLLIFGARVIAVKGSYDDAFDLSLKATEKFGWYNRNTGFNPYLSEGKKTVALEICEQLDFKAPDRIYVQVGDGCIIGGVYKGFKDMFELGLIEKMPKIIAVQSELSAAIVNALKTDGIIKPVNATTIADSISVNMPRDGLKALRAVRETGGYGIAVSDEKILETMKICARYSAIFGEPAGVTGLAGVIEDKNNIKDDETVVVIITGNGLKDIKTAMSIAGEYEKIEPDIVELEKLIKC